LSVSNVSAKIVSMFVLPKSSVQSDIDRVPESSVRAISRGTD